MSIESPVFLTLLSTVAWAAAVGCAVVWVFPVWDRLTATLVAELTPRMRELSLDDSKLSVYLRWWGAAMLLILLLGAYQGLWVLGLFVVFLVFVSPRLILAAHIRRRTYLLRDQMVGACVALANACRAGLSLSQGCEKVSEEIPEPLATEFRKVVRGNQAGLPMEDCITETKQRLRIDSFTLFAAAILICLERGGRVTDALDRISRSLQENQRLERKLEAETAGGRKVVVILGAFPLLFLALFALLEPEGTGYLFSAWTGQLVLVIVGVLIYIGARWAYKILTIEI